MFKKLAPGSNKFASEKPEFGKTALLRFQPCRIGFYICHCGLNIASKVNVEAVREYVETLEGIIVSRDYKFMCSEPGQAMIEKDIRELGLNRVVVASCSPRLHGKTFMEACRRAGLNPYYFQMSSVREQVSWVTEDELLATQKAMHLVTAAIQRVKFHDHLETKTSGVNPNVVIVGGGIAGMQAAIDVGNSGHKAYLIEKDTTIGGHMLQFDKTFPTLDCAACIGTPKMVEVGQNPNIELLSFSEVTNVSGFIGNFTVDVRQKSRYINQNLCTGCGECAKVCPVFIPNPWDMGMAQRKAIGRAFPQAIPITYNIEKKQTAPCRLTCPAGINVQGYIQLVKQKKYDQAFRLIMEKAPFPGVLGRVCPHPCEAECRRKFVDAPIAIKELKRFVADRASLEDTYIPEILDREEKIAVIGAGPAGLTAAYFLRLKGYRVTVFEKLPVPGGMLKTGIPDYRLPSDVLDGEINTILAHGINLVTDTAFGKDITFESLEKEGFDALFLSSGAHESLTLGLEGEASAKGVMDAISFLRDVNLGCKTDCGKKVMIVGGGNVAIDAARCAKRTGNCEVTIIYRRTRQEMPAYEEEITGALEENIEILTLTTPAKIITRDGRVAGIECIKNKLGEKDDSGRQRPVNILGSEFVIECDTIIPAIGQKTDLSWANSMPGLEITSYNRIKTHPDTLQTSLENVFAGGDMVTGPATVIEAIAQGRKAATGIDNYINNIQTHKDDNDIYNGKETDHGNDANQAVKLENYSEIPSNTMVEERACVHSIDPEQRVLSYEEVEATLTEEQAVKEAQRCLNCATCCECMECMSVCEAKAIDHFMKEKTVQLQAGSIILATGYDTLEPTPMKQFGYGRFANVFSALEFERLSNATGPTGGKILMRDKNNEFVKPPESVAIVHCIGSRDVNFHEYCSRVCCMYALKYTHLIKEKVGHDTKVYDFYIDMRCFGEGYEEFYKRCQEEGTIFIRGKVAQITDKPDKSSEQGKLIAIAEDTLLGELVRVPVDMIILCTAIQARQDAGDVGRVFGVNQGADGFFLEEHPKLAPLNTATEGVFLCGCCQKPMDIPDTVSQASGAAAKALSLAAKGRVDIAPTISFIDPDVCVGCKTCISLCPYSAIEFDDRRLVSVVNEAVCKGCGSCSGVCPSGAAQSRHFTKKQIFAEISGIF
ncbi:NAD(P)-binding protein [Desulfobacula phenolica]|uniref:Heterodisulfide reductase subunit A n=1 Tax=Desulfobacula phenolica TaxID=90732 RepID=A0A1H2GGC4_9BACT|nr:NAD(P)-binding protein [Desulfobacula phenolica]SDU18559.1 heterodisulfide reductase subunit A [Desulfobacula phenolica]